MKIKRIFSSMLILILLLGMCAIPVSAKTLVSAKADNVFFYAMNAEGKSVLLKVMPLDELKTLAHGQENGKNYYISTTDNYPTTQYCEARGFTVDELLNYVKSVTTVKDAWQLDFHGNDTLRLMATDSYGNYSRSWTWNELYGVTRYYFEGLYDSQTGWNTGWEVAGEDNAMFGVTLEEYNANYRDSDPYYENKRAVFSSGVETTVILATESYSGRTTTETLVASTEPGIAAYIRKNRNKAAGCLADVITDEYALRLSLPMTEADLMAAHRTAYDNFKWIYNLCLDMENAPGFSSLGTVAEPVPSFTLSGNTLTVRFSCATTGASIYYGYDGAPQTLYTGPITVDVSDRNLSSDPVTVYATAVKEGYDDAGVLTFKYPGLAPTLQSVYSSMAGEDLTYTAADTVTDADWLSWTSALNFVTCKIPSSGGYVTLEQDLYRIDNSSRSITFDKTLFSENGSYSFIFHATKYADKSVSVSIKKKAPELQAPESLEFGQPLTLSFDDLDYTSGLYLYIESGDGARGMLSGSYLDRTEPGKLTIMADYFVSPSTAIPGAGVYTLELVNNGYSPASQYVSVRLTGEFVDVPPDSWYYEPVMSAVQQNLIDPVYGGFQPDSPMTREMLVEALYRFSGSPEVTSETPFTDCDAASITWAYENGVVTGVGGGLFDSEGSITREQLVTIFYRYASVIAGADMTPVDTLSRFEDAGQLSAYAVDSMKWAVGAGLIRGTTDVTISPQGTATRAECATLILRLTAFLDAD